MIDSRELRIGNYVNYNDGSGHDDIRQVVGIDRNSVTSVIKGCHFATAIKSNDLIYPIPLSEEVLLKCGCNISNLTIGLRYNHLYRLVWDDEFKYWDILQGEYGYFITRIQYLHEWQNFIHIVNGEELEVKWN